MLKKFTLKMDKGLLIALVGIVVSVFLFSNAAKQPEPVEAAASNQGAVVSEMVDPMSLPDPNLGNAASAVWTNCTPVNVAVFDVRVHVKCAESVAGIRFFAKSTADAGEAGRVLSLLSTAQAMGRPLAILYDPADTSGASINCLTSDCRLILGVALQ